MHTGHIKINKAIVCILNFGANQEYSFVLKTTFVIMVFMLKSLEIALDTILSIYRNLYDGHHDLVYRY